MNIKKYLSWAFSLVVVAGSLAIGSNMLGQASMNQTPQIIIDGPVGMVNVEVPVLETRIPYDGLGVLSGSYQIGGFRPDNCSDELENRLYIIREGRKFSSIDQLHGIEVEQDYSVYVCVMDSRGLYSDVAETSFRITKPKVTRFKMDLNGHLFFAFNQPMKRSTVKHPNVIVYENANVIPGQVITISDTEYRFEPADPFDKEIEYTFVVKNDARNKDMVRLDQDLNTDGWNEFKRFFKGNYTYEKNDLGVIQNKQIFYIGNTDTYSYREVPRPYVVYVDANHAGKVFFRFNEPVKTSSVNTLTSLVMLDTSVVPAGIEKLSATEFVLTPRDPFEFGTTYKFRVKTDVRNISHQARLDQNQDIRDGLQEFYYFFQLNGENNNTTVAYPYITMNTDGEKVHHYYKNSPPTGETLSIINGEVVRLDGTLMSGSIQEEQDRYTNLNDYKQPFEGVKSNLYDQKTPFYGIDGNKEIDTILYKQQEPYIIAQDEIIVYEPKEVKSVITEEAKTLQQKDLNSFVNTSCADISSRVASEVFNDIDYSSWVNPYASALVECGALPGPKSIYGKAYPWEKTTRGEFVRLILKVFNVDVEYGLAMPFRDVSPVHNYYNEIATAYKNGIVFGYEDGSFRPDATIMRQEALRIGLEGAGFEPYLYQAQASFYDVSKAHWAHKYTSFAKEYNVTAGYEDGSFRGENLISNGEFWKVIVNIAQLKEAWFPPTN